MPTERPAIQLSRRAFSGGALTVAWLCASRYRAEAAEYAGRVNAIRGSASASRDGSATELQAGSEIFAGDVVETAGDTRLEIAIEEDVRLKLGEHTRLALKPRAEPGRREIRLEQGAILSEAPESETTEVVLEMPLGVVSGRGAHFFAGPSNGVVGVFVAQGSARVETKAGATDLQAGQGTDLTSADAAPTAARQWGEARIAAALASVS